MRIEDDSTEREEQPALANGHSRPVVPPCDVYENAEEYLIVADVPGADEQSVDIKLDRTRLTIAAHRASRGTGRVAESEPFPRVYLRAFQVPESIDAASIRAELKHGVLQVHLPKGAAARVRRIAVSTA
jgi:HSP20 family molecular chaperone IbpA